MHTNQMKLWTIYQGKIFFLNECRNGVSISFCVDLFLPFLSHCPLAGWIEARVWPHIPQTNFKYHPFAPICARFFFSNRKRREWQCDLPTQNLNCICSSRKMAITNTVMHTWEKMNLTPEADIFFNVFIRCALLIWLLSSFFSGS